MEKHLGIDFGTKRIGVALSDDAGRIAFPHTILSNDNKLLQGLASLVRDTGVVGIVVGESRDLAGKFNAVMKDAASFARALEEESGVPVFYEPEFFSTKEAANMQDASSKLDAGAAAVILQSFLDKRNREGASDVHE